MAVVINEFEIVPEQPVASSSTLSQQPSGETERGGAAPEVERIMQHFMERELRLWAH